MSLLTVMLVGVLAAAITAPLAERLVTAPRRPTATGTSTSKDIGTGTGDERRRRTPGRAVIAVIEAVDRRRRTRRGLGPTDVAAWCDALARRLRAGETLRSAVQAERPDDRLLAEITDPIRRGLERGVPLTAAMGPADDRHGVNVVGHRHLDLARTAIATVAELGGSGAEPLDRVAITLRLRAADDSERATHSSQARLSAHVLTVLPLGVLAVLATTDAAVRAVLMGPFGAACVALGLTLNVSGWWWMRRIIGTVG